MMLGRKTIQNLTLRALPFSDAVSEQLPLGQLLRLSLFQVSVGMAAVMLLGTLNRVMIVELSVAAWIVAIMIAIPVLVAPFRALLGFRSDTYRSAIGWKAYSLPLVWVTLAVRWPCHHADGPVGSIRRSGCWPRMGRQSWGRFGVPFDRSWHAHDPNGGSGVGR